MGCACSSDDHSQVASEFANQEVDKLAEPSPAGRSHDDLPLAHADTAADILNAMSEVAMVISSDFMILAASPGLAASLGKPLEALISTPALSHLPAEIAAIRSARMVEVIRSRQPVHFEDGNRGRIFANAIYPVLDAHGQVSRLAAFCRDITEQRRAEQQARERTQVLTSILAASPVGIGLARDRTPVWVNDAMAEMGGHSVEEHLSSAPRALYVDDAEFARVGEALYGGAATSDTREVNTTWVRGDGSSIQVHLQARPLDADDVTQGYIVTSSDVTERLRYEKELRASLERYRGLYDAMPGGVMVYSAEGRLIDANDAACGMLGLPRERVLGRALPWTRWRAIREDGSPFPEDAWPSTVSLLTGQRVRNVVVGVYAAESGECTWLLANSEPRIDLATGQMEAVVVTLLDISDRKRVEAALQESEQRFRTAFAEAPIGISLTGLDGTLLRVNRALCAMLGRSEDELVSGNAASVTHPDDVEMTRSWMRQMVEQRESLCQFEKRFIHKDGRVIYAELSSVLLRDPEGCPLHFVSHILDVTARKQAEAALLESERRFREMAELLPDMVFELDGDLSITYINQGVSTVLGYCQDDLQAGLRVADVVDADTLARAQDGFSDAVRLGQPLIGAYSIRAKDGRIIPTEVHAMGIVRPDGELVGYRGVLRDVTDREKAEDAHRLASLGQLAAGVGHEFNNLLASLMLEAELTDEDRSDASYGMLVATALAVARLGRDVCKNLTTFARPEPSRREPLYAEAIVESALALSSHQIETAEVVVTRDYRTDGQRVYADGGQLGQVFVNLFVNACHAMPGGGKLIIKTRHMPRAGSDGDIVVTVTDTGAGIAPAHLPRIFEPFFTTKGRLGESGVPGTGLGLSVSHGIVQAHGGQISARSEVGAGTTFELRLPTHSSAPAMPAREPEPAAAPVSSSGRTVRVLVAEDSLPLSALMRAILTTNGHQVDCVHTTQDAISALRERRYELVITDLLMPGGGGREVLKFAKSAEGQPLVLVTTGLMEAQAERDALEMGACGVIHKPFSRAELSQSVDAVLAAVDGPAADPTG